MTGFDVVVGAGSLRSTTPDIVSFPHRWSTDGVTVKAAFTGAHLLQLAAAGCVFNDVYREAVQMGMEIRGVRVTAFGGFDTDTWESTGISYVVEVDSPASGDEQNALLEAVDSVAEIPKSIRVGTSVERVRA